MTSETTKAEAMKMLGETPESFLPATLTPIPPLPAKPVVPKHDVAVYAKEKRIGVRRANGARKLKKLSSRHMKIISLHLKGSSGEEIAQTIGCTVITVSRILNDPLAKDLLSRIYEDRRAEIDALAGDAIDVVRQGLQGDHSIREKLTAVDKFTKLKDSIGKTEDEQMTAEDVIQKLFNTMSVEGDLNVQINTGERNG
jgi:hypothetical protein